jgi:hypothetical protein
MTTSTQKRTIIRLPVDPSARIEHVHLVYPRRDG